MRCSFSWLPPKIGHPPSSCYTVALCLAYNVNSARSEWHLRGWVFCGKLSLSLQLLDRHVRTWLADLVRKILHYCCIYPLRNAFSQSAVLFAYRFCDIHAIQFAERSFNIGAEMFTYQVKPDEVVAQISIERNRCVLWVDHRIGPHISFRVHLFNVIPSDTSTPSIHDHTAQTPMFMFDSIDNGR